MVDQAVITDFFVAAVLTATPLIFAACGGCFLERAGVYAIALEGMMLMGAFFGVLGANATGSVAVGILSALAAGASTAIVMVVAAVTLRADQIVTALAVNILALGTTGYLLSVAFGTSLDPSKIPHLGEEAIPGLHRIPVIGPALFDQSVMTYVAYALVPASAFVLFRTHWGLSVRAVGENPAASDTVGISPWRIRYSAAAACGALAGIGGGVLSLQIAGTFTPNMTAGRGFIGLAAVIFGRWNPLLASGAALLFGLADSLQVRFQVLGVGVSSYFVQMIPYVAAVVALIALGGRARYAAAIGRPYNRGDV